MRRGRPVTAPNRCLSCSDLRPNRLLFARERTFAHPRAISLGQSDHRIDRIRSHPGPNRRPAGSGARRGDKRISPVIDVEHRALRALQTKSTSPAAIARFSKTCRIADERCDLVRTPLHIRRTFCLRRAARILNSACAIVFFSRQAFSICFFSNCRSSSPPRAIRDAPSCPRKPDQCHAKSSQSSRRPGAFSAANSIMRW